MQGTRTPEECESMYNNVLDFAINKEPFTKEEDEKMEKFARATKERNWDKIAKALKVCCFPVERSTFDVYHSICQ